VATPARVSSALASIGAVVKAVHGRLTGGNRRVVAASGLIRDEQGRVLLVETGIGKRAWNMPGGRVERRERPDEAAVREIREETGLDVELGDLLLVDGRGSRAIVFVFGCTVIGGQERPQPGEIHQLRWTDEAERERLRLKGHGRLAAALRAADEGRVLYLPERVAAPDAGS
jgi:ADP-ribose pyrophosphatase YjhB (NUDIX family)